MAPYNPLAPLTPKQQRKQALRYVNALVNPLMRQLEAQFNRQLRGGGQAIQGYTQQLQASLAPAAGQTQARYAVADQQLAGIDNALANRLTAAGQSAGSELNAKLQAAGIQGSSQQDPAAIGAGAGAAGFAKGSFARQALVQQGAAATDYAASLPGIAGLQGGQSLRNYSTQLANQRQTAMENLRAQVPGLAERIGTQLSNLELQKAAASLGFVGDTAKLGLQQQQFGAQQQQDQAQFAETVRHHQATERISASKSTGKNSKARQSAVGQATTKAKSILDAAVKPVAAPGSSSSGSLLVPGGAAQRKRIPNYYGTLKKVVGIVTPILSPYMSRPEIIRFSQQLANSYYAPGQYGRPGRGTKAKTIAPRDRPR